MKEEKEKIKEKVFEEHSDLDDALDLCIKETAKQIFDDIENNIVSSEQNMDWTINAFDLEELKKKWCKE
jgi:uncharacterized protein YjgD (DUF1641 family)